MSASRLRRHAQISRAFGRAVSPARNTPKSGSAPKPPPSQVWLSGGKVVTIRAIRPSDAAGLVDFYARLSPESRRARFFTASTTKRRVDAERLAAVSGRYDCVLVATDPASDGPERLAAVAQLADFGDGVEAALVVADDYQGMGLGSILFDHLLRVGEQRGVRRVEATVLSNNNRILRILRQHHARLGSPENGVQTATIGGPIEAGPALGALGT